MFNAATKKYILVVVSNLRGIYMALDDKKVLKLVVNQVRNQIRLCSLEFSKMVASLANPEHIRP
jgi:hypothetical protein